MLNLFRRISRFAAHVVKRRPFRGGWLPRYVRQRMRARETCPDPETPIDVMVCIVDHFEPGDHRGDLVAGRRVDDWCRDYAAMVDGHRDSDGVAPQHTWFYRFEYLNPHCVSALSKYVFRGLGEIEFHLHHAFDDHDSFSQKIADGLKLAQSFGAMLTAERDPQTRFGYIAGNWSLDNGTGDPCKGGCNTEIGALRDLGCFADFTFPAIGNIAQPKQVNSIYYATNCEKPKSYNTGTEVRAGNAQCGDLMICQGPVVIDISKSYVETSAIESFSPPYRFRLARWLDGNVHVAGRPEWKFIKLHTHGTQSRDAWFGGRFKSMFEELESRWKQPPYRLHYVTAREMYNIVKAAEAGMSGNPNAFRDFEIAKPANHWFHCDQPWQLDRFDDETIAITFLNSGTKRISLAVTQVESISGELLGIQLQLDKGKVFGMRIKSKSDVEIISREALSFEPDCPGHSARIRFSPHRSPTVHPASVCEVV